MESPTLILEEGDLGSLSEIVTTHNNLIDYARIQTIGEGILEFRPCRPGQELPELYFGMPVKINIHNCRMGFKVLGGIVSRSGKELLKVSGLEILAASDRRQFLRIKTNAAGEVYLLNDDMAKADGHSVRVNIEDIGLEGLQFSTPMVYVLHSNILVILQLFELSLELRCVIRRITKGDGEGTSYYYGCQYVTLNQDEEEKLYKMLLRLQQDRRAKHNR